MSEQLPFESGSSAHFGWALIMYVANEAASVSQKRPLVQRFADESDALQAKRDFKQRYPHGVCSVVKGDHSALRRISRIKGDPMKGGRNI
jgi:hypothetical protein